MSLPQGTAWYPRPLIKESTFKLAMEDCGLWVEVTGMSAAIPINKVKAYLQERGINPDDFGWESVEKEYWEK